MAHSTQAPVSNGVIGEKDGEVWSLRHRPRVYIAQLIASQLTKYGSQFITSTKRKSKILVPRSYYCGFSCWARGVSAAVCVLYCGWSYGRTNMVMIGILGVV